MRDDIRRYQMRADAAPRKIWNYDDVHVGNDRNGFVNDYQARAEAAPRQIWSYDDVKTPYSPMDADMSRWQNRANAGHPAIMAADDIQLGRLHGVYGRRSGSMLRAFRSTGHLLGDNDATLPDTTRRISLGGDSAWFTWTNAAIVAAAGLLGYGIYRVAK